VKDIGIFGSYVRSEQKRNSDVDLLVEFSEPVGLFEYMALEKFLSGLLGIKVDLVSKKAFERNCGGCNINRCLCGCQCVCVRLPEE
jgi:hypothetical protein